MIKPGRTSLFALAGALLVLALWQAWADRPPRKTVRVLVSKYLSYTPLFVAYEEGFFAAEGLEVELIESTGAAAAIPALVEGEIDVLPVAIAPFFFNVVNRGGLMRTVAGKGHYASDGCVYGALMARRALVESGELDRPGGLVGRRVSTDRSSPSYFRLEQALEARGLTLDDVTVIDLPAAARLDAFASGALDITTASEPWVTRYQRGGHAVIWKRAGETVSEFQFGQVLFGRTLLKDRPEDGEKFMLAYLRTLRHLNETGKGHGHVNLLAKHTRLDPDLLQQACWPHLWGDGRVDRNSLERYQRWAVGQGLVSFPAPIDKIYEPRFIEYASRQLARELGLNTP